MTCQDCKHFTDNILGELHRCDYEHEHIALMHVKDDAEICDHFECRYTCSECVHIKPDEDEDRYHCEKCIYGDTYVALDCPANRWCRDKFEPKDDSWESVSK